MLLFKISSVHIESLQWNGIRISGREHLLLSEAKHKFQQIQEAYSVYQTRGRELCTKLDYMIPMMKTMRACDAGDLRQMMLRESLQPGRVAEDAVGNAQEFQSAPWFVDRLKNTIARRGRNGSEWERVQYFWQQAGAFMIRLDESAL
ncbi:uncharacterized protein LOC120215158 [Hibiscus syriacus]|uniref:uncharacterized protein LOC120215158 n=1 Tax=Hibiscus syriacus TaxID=106335 RepID=UPI001925011B|nr:uncharacterized protein LOC120215158 [Hibiscus syriacus]